MTVKVFRAGNSEVMTIPRSILQEIGVKVGQEVAVERVPETKSFIVTPVEEKIKKTPAKDELEKWFAMFLKENGGILDDLA